MNRAKPDKLLGFEVDIILDGSLEEMETAVIALKDNLKQSIDSYGFFFYAGHGVQSGGENYLIPVNASIPSESFLRNRALSVQVVLDDLNEAGNSLNVVVLDACRDNPFAWSRSSSSSGRGLAIVSRQPAGSIIVYATSAGQTASDGEGRNGLFTSQLLRNLETPGLEVKEIFNRTGADVSAVSSNRQIPAIYSQFFGTAYLGGMPDTSGAAEARPTPAAPQPLPETGSPAVTGGQRERPSRNPDRLWSVGASAGTAFAAPWFVGTVRGTIAPLNHFFAELGFDAGFASGRSGMSYYSLYPYAHAAYFRPLNDTIALYAGAGGGYMMETFNFTGLADPYTANAFAASFTFGMTFFNMLDVSYALRSDFSRVTHKVSVGYFYRFR